MRDKKMPEIRKGSGFLLGRQSADYFDFVCGDCGRHIGRITVDDVDAGGFKFTAKCEECKREWGGMKVSARWGEAMSPHITARYHEKSEHLRGL